MSIDPILLGVAAPTVVSSASTASRAISTATQPFRTALQSASQLLTLGKEAASPEQASADNSPKLTIEDLRTQANQSQSDLEQRIQDALSSAGIKLESPLRLRISGLDGSIEVSGIHPQRAVIEAALNSNPTLAADFQQLSAERTILDRYAHSKSFAEDFDADPSHVVAAQARKTSEHNEALLTADFTHGRIQLQFD